MVGVLVGVGLGVRVAVGVSVWVGVGVSVVLGSGVLVLLAVGVRVRVGTGVLVLVGASVGVAVGTGVLLRVGVMGMEVAVGSPAGPPTLWSWLAACGTAAGCVGVGVGNVQPASRISAEIVIAGKIRRDILDRLRNVDYSGTAAGRLF